MLFAVCVQQRVIVVQLFHLPEVAHTDLNDRHGQRNVAGRDDAVDGQFKVGHSTVGEDEEDVIVLVGFCVDRPLGLALHRFDQQFKVGRPAEPYLVERPFVRQRCD